MPRKKRGDNRGSSPEKVPQSGSKPRLGHQYGGTTGDVWSEVGKKTAQIGQGLTPEQEKIYFELQEMFVGVDGEVIYVVLTESDWRGQYIQHTLISKVPPPLCSTDHGMWSCLQI